MNYSLIERFSMKILYLTESDIWTDAFIGVRKKIFAQINCFSSNHMEVYLAAQQGCFFCFFYKDQLIEKSLPLCKEEKFQLIIEFIQRQNISFVFIRNIMANAPYIQFLKKLRRSGINIIIEYPTIPYDKEFPENSYILMEDQYYRNHEKKYVRSSTNYNGLSKVYRIPSIPLANGIHLPDIPLRHVQPHQGVVLLAVATMNKGHGYDRLLQGISDYYGSSSTQPEEIRLLFVGDGPEIPKYKQMAEQGNIAPFVKFYGLLSDDKLSEVYDKADIAIGGLGLSRLGQEKSNPIKTKEYCARGIPFVIGYEDLSFSKPCDFVLEVPNNEEALNIHELLEFNKKMRDHIKSEEIRQYAEMHLTWDVILKPVIDYIFKHV